jgi:membrane protein implicated in regulation of membrane protease activity
MKDILILGMKRLVALIVTLGIIALWFGGCALAITWGFSEHGCIGADCSESLPISAKLWASASVIFTIVATAFFLGLYKRDDATESRKDVEPSRHRLKNWPWA